LRQAVVSGETKQPAAARQGKPLANHTGFSSNCRELCRLHGSKPVVQIFAPTGTQFPPHFRWKRWGKPSGCRFLPRTHRARVEGLQNGAAPMQRGRVLLNCFTGPGLDDGVLSCESLHGRSTCERPVPQLPRACGEKRKLRPTAHNPCTRKTGLNGFVPASFLLGEALPTSRDRSVPILDAEQGCMVRHTKGTRSQLKPPLLSTPPFAPASCPRFGNLGTQGPGSWPHIPCLRIGALFGAAAAEKSSAATTSHKYTNSNPAFSRCCMGSHARATLIYTQAARSAVRALP
jgi:hypothetical protein